MSLERWWLGTVTALLLCLLLYCRATAAALVVGLDHIPLAVSDLDEAVARYRSLGFALKPGRPHENGIRNQHVKFPDGTEIELINASEARDILTSQYVRHLQAGDGPAFLGLYAPDLNSLAARLAALQQPSERAGGLLTLPSPPALSYLFFAGRNRSPTDLPEHFAHANTAQSLSGVWLAVEDAQLERRLLESLGATLVEQDVFVPAKLRATIAKLDQGEVVLLPASRRTVAGRVIVGATLQVTDLSPLRQKLAGAQLRAPDVIEIEARYSILLAPRVTHGLWLEFRELPRAKH